MLHQLSKATFHSKNAFLFAVFASLFFMTLGCGASKEAAVEQSPSTESMDSSESSDSMPAPTTSMDASPPASVAEDDGQADSLSMESDPQITSPETNMLDSSPGGATDSRPGDSSTSGLSGPLQPPATGTVLESPSSNSTSGSSVNPDGSSQPATTDTPEELPTYDATNPLEDAAKTAFAPPPEMKRLSGESSLWLDTEQKRLVVDGYVAITQGPLEMFACPTGTKEHESIVAVLAKAREVHAGLLAIGADSGTPVAFSPEYRPATGQRIAIWCLWRDADGNIQKSPAQNWVKNLRNDKPLELDWVFAGSSFWKDPETGREYYQADSGDLVCVSNFSTAMMDLPIESSQSNGELIFVANTEKIPAPGTPVRLVFVPIPIAGTEAKPGAADPKAAPEDSLLVSQSN